MSKSFDWEEAREVAGIAARSIARSYPGISADDIEQGILESVTRREGTFKRMKYGRDALGNIFRKYGTEYANNERLSALNFNDQYHYTVGEVRTLLTKALFDRDAFLASVESDPEMVSRFDEIVARVVDLQAAYADASDADKAIIERRFISGDALTPAEAKASQRAVDRLSLAINQGRSYRRGDHDGPGGRKAMTNARARAMSATTYDGSGS